MCPDSLREGLKNAKRPPKYLYINPTGANPTGTILSEKRRSEIYKLVCQHDLILLEDDPYYYVQVQSKDRAYYDHSYNDHGYNEFTAMTNK
jgi:DNA-binding transcriptional MocR family regulator